jgi:hypothetical protein
MYLFWYTTSYGYTSFSVVTPSMIWVSIFYVAHVNEYIATHDMFQNIIATIVLENGAHIQKVFLTIHENKWILLSPKTIFVSWRTLSLLIQLV